MYQVRLICVKNFANKAWRWHEHFARNSNSTTITMAGRTASCDPVNAKARTRNTSHKRIKREIRIDKALFPRTMTDGVCSVHVSIFHPRSASHTPFRLIHQFFVWLSNPVLWTVIVIGISVTVICPSTFAEKSWKAKSWRELDVMENYAQQKHGECYIYVFISILSFPDAN